MATFNVGDLSNALAAVVEQASVSTTTTLPTNELQGLPNPKDSWIHISIFS